MWVLRNVLAPLSGVEAKELLLDKMAKTKSSGDFLSSMHNMARRLRTISMADKSSLRGNE